MRLLRVLAWGFLAGEFILLIIYYPFSRTWKNFLFVCLCWVQDDVGKIGEMEGMVGLRLIGAVGVVAM
jgi:hypothetical protein